MRSIVRASARPQAAKAPRALPRVRKEPPTLEEAVLAARDITADLDQQVAFAAGLMSVPEEEVRPLVMKALAERAPRERIISAGGRDGSGYGPGARRVVVVERRPLRRPGLARA